MDLVAKNYFMRSEPDDNKGGKDHPRKLNEKVWNSACVCYVEISSAFPGVSSTFLFYFGCSAGADDIDARQYGRYSCDG